ncbi:MAG: hypothetical protein EHM49_00225 [Deltaproteobacteria bacterium]|nr:MAG: hypothetical protein EHM49_00225 [Deltaproteobacteria bacterium]
MKGSAGIPALELVTLNKLISKFDRAPSMFFSNLFPTQPYDSDSIKWEIEYGTSGMTPFVAPGSIAPAIGIDGVGEASAKAAYWKEKMYFDEEFLNNLREPGTWATYQTAERKLARGAMKLRNRCDRRREWMTANMLINGTLSYLQKGGTRFSISYGVPTTHQVTLTGNDRWNVTHADSQPVEDVFDGKKVISEDSLSQPNYAVLNSELLKVLLMKASIQDLLKSSAFGDGDLFKNPSMVIGTLLGVGPLVVYDEMFEVTGWLTGNVTGGATVAIPVDDASDFEAGGTLRFIDMSEVNTWEDETIASVDVVAGTVTVSVAPTMSFKANEDKVVMRKKFIPDNVFFMFADTAQGEKIAEFMEAPFGLGRHWGMYADTKDQWDPEGIYLRLQDKGIPVLYHPDTSYKLTVY